MGNFGGEAFNHAVLTVENGVVVLHSKGGMKTSIQGCKNAVSAQWSGDYLLVTLSDGKVRRYSNLSSYSTIA